MTHFALVIGIIGTFITLSPILLLLQYEEKEEFLWVGGGGIKPIHFIWNLFSLILEVCSFYFLNNESQSFLFWGKGFN